jgi:hypothetical protein
MVIREQAGMLQSQSGIRRKLETLRYLYRNGGLSGVLVSLFYKLANRFTRLLVLRAAIEPQALLEAHLGCLDAYRHGLFTSAELEPFVNDPDTDLTCEFLDYAAAQGDTCYAIFEGNVLVNYCWNSDKPTRIERDLFMCFRPGYTYRYKAYTRPSHRGRRLSSYNNAESLRLFAGAGMQGFAGYVDVNNYISYRTLQRKNHQFPGFIVILGKGSKPWIWHSRQAGEWGFRVISTSPGLEQAGSGPYVQGILGQSGN